MATLRGWRLSSAILLALFWHATKNVGGVFTNWAARPKRSELSEVARHVGSSDDLAREVQAIIDELRLDDPLTDSSSSSSLRQSRTQALTQTAPPIPRATALEEKRPFVAQDSNYMQARSLRDQLEAQERRKQELLEEQRLHDLELRQLRQQQEELQRQEARQRSARPPEPAAATPLAPRPSTPPDGLLAALHQWGIRQAPELGQDVFVASLPQIKMLIRAQGDQAGRTHVAGLQALQRYVEQLEMDLDNKEEELSSTKSQLHEEQQRRLEVQSQQDAAQLDESKDVQADAALQAEVQRLEEELANALQGQQEVQSQLEQQVQRAEAAEAKLITLVERIRGAATAKAR